MSSGVDLASGPAAARALVAAYQLQAATESDRAVAVETLRFIDANADCLWRTCQRGHLTGSAWIVDPSRRRTLLTLHRKLGKWLQLGGHADGESDLSEVALRETREESGLESVHLLSADLFDLDCHWIPERKCDAGHHHYDFRFLVEADDRAPLIVSEESHQLAWIDLDDVHRLNPEPSLLRLVQKTREWSGS